MSEDRIVERRRQAARVRQRCRRRRAQVAAMTLLVVLPPLAATPAEAMPPLDTGPSSDGMPGAAFLGQVFAWGVWVGLLVCGAVFIYGAAAWKGWGSASAGRSADGKGHVVAGAVGAALIGLVGFVIPMMYNAANG